MKKTHFLCQGVACLALLSLVAGCDSQTDANATSAEHGDDHGHGHDHADSDLPESLRAAIAELRELRAQVDAAVTGDDPESAHEPLHQVGQLLKAMPDLAADTDLTEAEWDDVKQHVDQLFESFRKIDSAFHKKDGDKQAAYEAARSSINEGISALEAKLPLLGGGEAEAAEAHEHSHKDSQDHDDHAAGE